MSRFLRAFAAAALLALDAGPAFAQNSDVPPLPTLTSDQSARVAQEVARYRSEQEARVARGEITPEEAERLIAWREWQLAQQAAGLAPRPPNDCPADDRDAGVSALLRTLPLLRAVLRSAAAYWGFSLCAGRGWGSGWGSLVI